MRLGQAGFWAAVALAVGVVVHLGYVLFAPGWAMERNLSRLAGLRGLNAMSVLSPAEAQALTGLVPEGSLYAVCPFDLDGGDLVVETTFPSAPWTLTVYSRSGARAFAVNDVQAGVGKITVRVTRAPDLIESLTAPAAPPELSDGWSVEVKQSTGVVLLWLAAGETVRRDAIAREFAASSCHTEPSAAVQSS